MRRLLLLSLLALLLVAGKNDPPSKNPDPVPTPTPCCKNDPPPDNGHPLPKNMIVWLGPVVVRDAP